MTIPNVGNALKGWEQPIILIEVKQAQQADLTFKTDTKETPFKAVVQPLQVYKVQLKPADMRSFEWLQIHLNEHSPVILKINDRIKWNNKLFKITELKNYTNTFLQTQRTAVKSVQTYGYIEYHACELNIKNEVNYTIND